MLKLLKKWSWAAIIALVVAAGGAWYWRRRQTIAYLRDVYTMSWADVSAKWKLTDAAAKARWAELKQAGWPDNLPALPKW